MSRRLICSGLLVTWIVHDTEEVLAASPWSASTVPRLRAEGWPATLTDAIGSSTAQFTVAAALVGVAVVAATIQGVRTGGESPFFRAAVLVYGWHGVLHLGQALIVRDYVPGLVTAALLVIPYAVLAGRRLPPARPGGRTVAVVAVAVVALTVAAQFLARMLLA